LTKIALGEGVSHLTIFDADRNPVCERLYFKRPTQPLTISLKTDRKDYVARTKVAVEASVQSAAKKNQAALSMAVYRLDSLASVGSGNILSIYG
jgi:hypothetical protein